MIVGCFEVLISFWFDHGTGFGSVVIWLPGCLVGLVSASKILGLLGLYKVRSGRGMAG